MADLADKASDYEELARSARIATASILANQPIQSSDECLNCGEPTNGRRFCDEYCSHDFHRREEIA